MPENPTETAAAVSAAPRLAVRHVQLGRAVLAAIAALMITFSSDHSAAFGLAVFSGFAITTALVLGSWAWMASGPVRRGPIVALALFTVVTGMVGGIPQWRTTAMFFVLVIAWAAISGAVELGTGLADRSAMRREGTLDPQRRSEARDAVTVGILTLALAAGTALVNPGFRVDFFIDDAGQWFALTGTTIAVGVFGGYAAVIAVFLGIAAFTPRREAPAVESAASGEPA
ncbi:MAG: acyl-CoA synthetase [Microbacterium sp.]